jgi:hypothetical protein
MHVKSFKMAIPRSLFLVALLSLVCTFTAVVRVDDGIPPSYKYGNEIVALKSKISELGQELDTLHTCQGETEDTKLAQLKIDSALLKVRELESQVQSLQEEFNKLRVEADLHANWAKTVPCSALPNVRNTSDPLQVALMDTDPTACLPRERNADCPVQLRTSLCKPTNHNPDGKHREYIPCWAKEVQANTERKDVVQQNPSRPPTICL